MTEPMPITITAREPSLWYIHGNLAYELTGMPNTASMPITFPARDYAFVAALVRLAQERIDEAAS